jgi:hypothetical protein
MQTDVTLEFGGKPTRFHIGQHELFLMEVAPSLYLRGPGGPSARVAVGPLYARILRGRYQVEGQDVGMPTQAEWSSRDLDIVIFYGLVGGGKSEDEAADLLAKHVNPMPLADRWNLAFAVLGACYEGATAKAA